MDETQIVSNVADAWNPSPPEIMDTRGFAIKLAPQCVALLEIR